MSYDYKNPIPPHKGDGRYNNKFKETYEVIDCLREHYYDIFKQDLNFNGGNSIPFGAIETNVYATTHTCKNCFGVSDKKAAFIFNIQHGILDNKDNHVELSITQDIFNAGNIDNILDFIKKSVKDITSREINLVVSGHNKIRFMYIPYDRNMGYCETYSTPGNIHYTSEHFIYFMNRFYDNIYYYINMISDDILNRLNKNELEFLNELINDGNVGRLQKYFLQEQKIEVGKKLEYLRLKH